MFLVFLSVAALTLSLVLWWCLLLAVGSVVGILGTRHKMLSHLVTFNTAPLITAWWHWLASEQLKTQHTDQMPSPDVLITLYLNTNSQTQTTRPSFLIVFLLQLTLDWFPQLLPCLSSCQLMLMVLARYDKCWGKYCIIFSWDVNYWLHRWGQALSHHKSRDCHLGHGVSWRLGPGQHR